MHTSHTPYPMDYAPQILTVMTSLLTVIIRVNLITVISSRCLPYLCTQEGVSPRIPSNLMASQHPCGICLHSLILINQSVISLPVSQSAFSSQFRPCPRRLQKPQNMLCFLHSDSDQQKDSINHTQPLTSSTCNTCQPHVLLCMLSSMAFKVSVHLSSIHIDPWIPHCLLLQ